MNDWTIFAIGFATAVVVLSIAVELLDRRGSDE